MPCTDGRLARRVLTASGGKHLAHDDFGNVIRLDACAAQCFDDSGRAKLGGAECAERSVERTDCGAHGTGYDNFGHGKVLLELLTPLSAGGRCDSIRLSVNRPECRLLLAVAGYVR